MAAASVGVGGAVLWLLGGVRPDELFVYVGYELAFVLLPGWLLFRAISPGTRSAAWQVAFGWPIGLTLEVLAFSLTAALNARDLFVLYPPLVGIPALLVALVRIRRIRVEQPSARGVRLFSSGSSWALAVLCILAFAYIGQSFAATPLPDALPASATGVSYHPDNTFFLSLSADALHHWPIADPGVAGQPFAYHYFANLHMAAIAQVTGLHLPLIMFRLFLLPLTALLVLQMGLAARIVTGRSWAGPLAVALLLLVRAIDISIYDPAPFTGDDLFFTQLNPSTVYGLAIFLPAVTLLYCLADPRVAGNGPAGLSTRHPELLAVLGILIVGSGGAKSVILPLLVGGLVIFLLWERISAGRVNRLLLTVTVFCAATFLIYVAILYGNGQSGLKASWLGTFDQMPVLSLLHMRLSGFPAGVAFWAIAVPVGLAMFFAPALIGLVWVRDKKSGRLEPAGRLAIALLLAGLPAFLFLRHDFQAQLYFSVYAIAAVFPLAAGGLIRFFSAPERLPELRRPRFAILTVAWVAVVSALAFGVDRVAAAGHVFRADVFLYGSLALALGLLVLAAVRSRGATRAFLSGFAVTALLVTAALDVPLDLMQTTVRPLLAGQPLYREERFGLNPRQVQGLDWIRDNLPDDAVLAVDNLRAIRERWLGPANRDYPAFAERRTFLQGWAYSERAYVLNHHTDAFTGEKRLFRGRRRLQEAVFNDADRAALRKMIDRFGVTDLVLEHKDGPVNPRVYRLGRLIYSNGAIQVIAV
jgi:hypothetical protein